MDEILILEKGDLEFLSDNSVIKILTNSQSSKNEDYDCKALNYLENYINSLGNSGAGNFKFLENFYMNNAEHQNIQNKNSSLINIRDKNFETVKQ